MCAFRLPMMSDLRFAREYHANAAFAKVGDLHFNTQ